MIDGGPALIAARIGYTADARHIAQPVQQRFDAGHGAAAGRGWVGRDRMPSLERAVIPWQSQQDVKHGRKRWGVVGKRQRMEEGEGGP